MRKLIYIKVLKGHIKVRTVGETQDKQYPCDGLNHPRSLAGTFSDVEKTFTKAIQDQPKSLFGIVKPKVLVHLIPKMEGGYTEVELRFFREATISGGVSSVYLLDDRCGPQEDHELLVL
jgi:hypothetical protein